MKLSSLLHHVEETKRERERRDMTMNEPIEELQSRRESIFHESESSKHSHSSSSVSQLKGTQASLQADLKHAKKRPSASQVKVAAKRGRTDLSHTLKELGRSVAEVEERSILYRTAGWTVFEMELDVGKRQRETRRQAGTSSLATKAALGLGVRLETFYQGRFYEPFYLIFARPSQLVKDEAKALAPALGDAATSSNATPSQRGIRLMRHTIPHFIPIGDILRSYMRPDNIADDEDQVETGGLQMLDGLMAREGLHFFLSQLHSYLQSFVSRRQQAVALAQLPLPGISQSSLRAFGNDSFGQLTVRWDLPTPTPKDLHLFQQQGELLYASKKKPDLMEMVINSKPQGTVNTSLEVSIVYHNLSGDRLGTPAKPLSERQQMIQALADDEVSGLKCTYATVLVEIIRSRVPAPRRGDSKPAEKLQLVRTRRTDLELVFTQPRDSLPDLEKALGAILQLAWKEEMQRSSSSQYGKGQT